MGRVAVNAARREVGVSGWNVGRGLVFAAMSLFAACGTGWGAGPTTAAQPFKRVLDVPIAAATGGAAAAHSARVAGEAPSQALATVLSVDPEAYRALEARALATIEVPIGGDRSLALDLERFDVLAPDAVFVVADERGDHPAPLPSVQFWHGRVAGDEHSRAFVGLTPSGAQGFIVVGDTTYSLATVPENGGLLAGQVVIAEAHELHAAAGHAQVGEPGPWTCGGALEVPGVHPLPAESSDEDDATPPALSTLCRTIRIAIDTDREFTSLRFGGNTAAASAYATQLMGAVASIYLRDLSVQLQVSFLRVWSGPSPYTSADTASQLQQFRLYWIANRPAPAHNLAHLLCGRAIGGGIAYVGVLCDPNFGFGLSANLNGSFPFPVQDNHGGNWDLNVVSHEIGHNFGTGHTHDPTAYNPPVDGCGNPYLTPSRPQDCSVAQAGQGTIMSYCHLCPGGEANLKMTFGPRPILKILNYLTQFAASCGQTGGTPPVVAAMTGPTGPTCRGGTAIISVTASGTNLTYSWEHNGSLMPGQTGASLVISNVSAANVGTYNCTVANSCAAIRTPSKLVTVCMPDYDCSGIVSVQDLLGFLNDWFANHPKADFGGDGTVGPQDLFDYLSAYHSGC